MELFGVHMVKNSRVRHLKNRDFKGAFPSIPAFQRGELFEGDDGSLKAIIGTLAAWIPEPRAFDEYASRRRA